MEVITIETTAFSKLLENIEDLTKSINRSSIAKPVNNRQKEEKKQDEWLTTEEACEFLKVSKRTLQKYRDELIIPYSQIQRKVFFKHSDLKALLENNYIKVDHE